MLVDTQYYNGKLTISFVNEDGEIEIKNYDWANPMKYEVCDEFDINAHPTYKSWDNKSVKQVPTQRPDRYAIYEFLDFLPEEERERIFKFNTPNIYFIDIETEIDPNVGFPEAEDIFNSNGDLVKEGAATQVLSLSIVYDDKIILMGLKDMPNDMQKRIIDKNNAYFKDIGGSYQFKYIKYEDEFEMLMHFFHVMLPKMPCITGWNFLNYDWVYLMNRIKKISKTINGKKIMIDPKKASPTGRLTRVFGKNYEVPMHKMIFDYMQLYEIADTSIKVKESSSLDFVSRKLVGVDKIKYTGSLQQLYDNDFETFMYYNAVDSVLVQKIHEARNYISIVYAISSLSRIKVTDVVSQMNNALASLAITEGVLRNRFREQDNIVLFKDATRQQSDEKGISGGYVKDPNTGMNMWCTTYDFASLYPRSQLQFFIAPETFVGLQSPTDKTRCTNGVEITDKHVVCVNGTVFEKRMSPTLNMLEDVYKDRKTNKNIMMEKKNELNEIQLKIKELEAML